MRAARWQCAARFFCAVSVQMTHVDILFLPMSLYIPSKAGVTQQDQVYQRATFATCCGKTVKMPGITPKLLKNTEHDNQGFLARPVLEQIGSYVLQKSKSKEAKSMEA